MLFFIVCYNQARNVHMSRQMGCRGMCTSAMSSCTWIMVMAKTNLVKFIITLQDSSVITFMLKFDSHSPMIVKQWHGTLFHSHWIQSKSHRNDFANIINNVKQHMCLRILRKQWYVPYRIGTVIRVPSWRSLWQRLCALMKISIPMNIKWKCR